MKIIKIEFENINSLAGKWSIDFTDPSFAAAHEMFVICGPTGAGKSTILDAVTLALYGRTPRQIKFVSENEVMTRDCGSCFARVTYRNRNEIYVSEWSQRRAREKAEGNLQQSDGVVYRLGEERSPLFSGKGSKSDFAAKNTEIIGLDYTQFCRSVLLAQGEFSQFLTCKEDERVKILERLNGTERYRKIGEKVGEHWAAANKEKELAASRFEALNAGMPQEEEIAEKERRKNEILTQVAEIKAILKRVEEEIGKHKEAEKAEREFFEASRKFEAAKKEKEAFSVNGQLIAKAEKAKNCEAAYTLSARLEKSGKESEAKLKEETKQLQAAEIALKKAASEKESAENEKNVCEKYIRENEALWNEIRMYDEQIKNAEKELSAADGHLKKAVSEEKAVEDMLKKSEIGLAELEKELEKAKNMKQQLMEKESRMLENDILFIADRMREHLSENEPCPVCGSREHPACGGIKHDVPEGAEPDLSSKAEEIRELGRQRKEAEERVNSYSEKKAAALGRKEETEKSLARLRNNSDAEKNAVSERKAALDGVRITRFEKFGEKNVSEAEKSAKKRLDDASGKYAEADAALRRNELKCSECRTNMNKTKSALEKNTAELSEAETLFAEKLKENGFADRDEFLAAKMDEDRLQKLLKKQKSVEEAVVASKTSAENAEEKLKAAKEALKGLKPRTELEAEAESMKEDHDKMINESGELSNSIAEYGRKKDALAALKREKDEKEENFRRWDTMYILLCSKKNGENFSKFVQGLAFRSLIGSANRYLARMRDRYRLEMKGELDFEIMDSHFDHPRSVTNLSGGEKFLVSLALALGIADLAGRGRNITLETLFLDEGFGTLDQETLRDVMDCLRRQQEEGKMLGIITHINYVVENMEQRIRIVPESNGHSKIEGPGVTRM